jgi:hypothetical protein
MNTDIKMDLDRILADGKMHDPSDRAAVVEAYVNLVECISVYRDQGVYPDIRKDS